MNYIIRNVPIIAFFHFARASMLIECEYNKLLNFDALFMTTGEPE